MRLILALFLLFVVVIIGVTGQGSSSSCGQTTITVTYEGNTVYYFDAFPGIQNTALTLVRGCTYNLIINAAGHPFYIKSVPSRGTADAYNTGVTNNGASQDTIIFTIPADAPSTLYYGCSFHFLMKGVINVINIDHCTPNPCLNGATCNNNATAYSCGCSNGFSDNNCGTQNNNCLSSPCVNGGTCMNGVGSFFCNCASGWFGSTCSAISNFCATNPCQNGAICTLMGCSCRSGFGGRTCSRSGLQRESTEWLRLAS